MARVRRPHFQETKPATAPVTVTRVAPSLMQTALRIAKHHSRIKVISAGKIELLLEPYEIKKLRERENG
jgi:hypothetical protein